MKKSSYILLLSVALIFVAYARRSPTRTAAPMPLAQGTKPSFPSVSVTQSPTPLTASALMIHLNKKSQSRPEALQALTTMTSVMAEFSRNDRTMNDLVDFLDKNKARPMVAQDANPYTGEMDLIRTRRPLNGTRYFSARYTGSGKERFLNRMSFDYEASPTALAEAAQSLRQAFQVSQAPSRQDDDQVVFDLGGGYMASARRMTWDDLKYSPTNAYSKTDVGTVRVTMQIDEEGE